LLLFYIHFYKFINYSMSKILLMSKGGGKNIIFGPFYKII
jgi:hypothetical protein